MTTDIIPFDHKGADKNVPAHLAAAFGEDSNIGPRQTINQLSYRGKVFRRVVDGEETTVTKLDPDTNDRVPVQIIQIVVLDHNKSRSRAFYEGDYVDGQNQAPTCFSGDGVKPDASVTDPCAATCAQCPNAVKGSKITQANKQTTACAPYKRVAVVPSASLLKDGHVPLLLRLAQTSVWDKENPEEAQGWYAWDQYLDMLRARGAQHTAAVETRVKFDASVAYPKLRFSASRWLSPDEAAAVKTQLAADADAIKGILNGKQSEDDMTGLPATPEAPAAAAAPTPAAKPAKAVKAEPDPAQVAAAAAAKAAEVETRRVADEKAEARRKLEAQLAALNAEPAVEAKAAAPEPATEPKAAAPTPTPAAVENTTPSSLQDLLNGWDA